MYIRYVLYTYMLQLLRQTYFDMPIREVWYFVF